MFNPIRAIRLWLDDLDGETRILAIMAGVTCVFAILILVALVALALIQG